MVLFILILYAIVTVLSPAIPVDTPALNQTMHQIGSQSIVTYLLQQDIPLGPFFFVVSDFRQPENRKVRMNSPAKLMQN